MSLAFDKDILRNYYALLISVVGCKIKGSDKRLYLSSDKALAMMGVEVQIADGDFIPPPPTNHNRRNAKGSKYFPSEESVEWLREQIDCGRTYNEIAEDVGCHPTHIGQIAKFRLGVEPRKKRRVER